MKGFEIEGLPKELVEKRLLESQICSKTLHIFYQIVEENAIFCAAGGIKDGDPRKLNKPIRKAGQVIAINPDTLEQVVQERVQAKLGA